MMQDLLKAIFWSIVLAACLCLINVRADLPDISIFDSQTMPGESFLLLDDCLVSLKTKKINDLCYVQKEIKTQCGTFYQLEKNCGKK